MRPQQASPANQSRLPEMLDFGAKVCILTTISSHCGPKMPLLERAFEYRNTQIAPLRRLRRRFLPMTMGSERLWVATLSQWFVELLA